MDPVIFPNPRVSTPEGLVAIGGDLNPETLITAYRQGLFPWPQENLPLLWFSPDPRGVLDFQELHIPRSLQKWIRKQGHLRWTINQGFPQVIRECQQQTRKSQTGTWILPEMEVGYIRLFDRGHILSLECWEGESLVGGIYGVLYSSKKGSLTFSGESMFHKKTNVSKLCLIKMVEYLKSQGLHWMDIQMVTEVTELLGGKYISREEFLERIGV